MDKIYSRNNNNNNNYSQKNSNNNINKSNNKKRKFDDLCVEDIDVDVNTDMKKKINVDVIKRKNILNYPFEFKGFCETNKLKPPSINSKNGIALSAMLNYPSFYWDRESCDKFVNKFNIDTKDSIQLFNKHEQWGIKTSNEIGKNYILHPYQMSTKHKMRHDFKFDGSNDEKHDEIEKIKSTIINDYINLPSCKWQLGHKNPEITDNTNTNLVLQPPIQAKYRDKYVFIDTLTKIPTPKTFAKMYKLGKCPYSHQQLLQMKKWLNKIKF